MVVSGNIIIVTKNANYRKKLVSYFKSFNYTVAATVGNLEECFCYAKKIKPAFIIIDTDISQHPDTINDIASSSGSGYNFIILIDSSRKKEIGKYSILQKAIYLEKPLSRKILQDTLELLHGYDEKIRHLEKKVEELNNMLETRKEVEKAKGLLMSNLNITEQEAFRRMQKQSMSKGLPMKEIAKAIILTYDSFMNDSVRN